MDATSILASIPKYSPPKKSAPPGRQPEGVVAPACWSTQAETDTVRVKMVRERTAAKPDDTVVATAPPGAVGPILLVLSQKERPKTALWRAKILAERLRAELKVIVCLQDPQQANMLFPQQNIDQTTARLRHERTARDQTLRWCNRSLPIPLADDALLLAYGSLVGCATAMAIALEAQIVVVSETDCLSGHDITAIVDGAGVSVLLSRTVRPANVVIAATDLRSDDMPVIRKGAALAQSLGARLSVAHNVEPLPPPPMFGSPDGMIHQASVPPAEATRRRLRVGALDRALAMVGSEAEPHVLARADTTDALLEVALDQNADLLVVGHRRRSWLSSIFGTSVANKVVDRSVRSILVVPVTT